jgi:hypothetical protein
VVSASDSHTVSSEGAGQSVLGTCTDVADNANTLIEGNINIDKTAPLISFLGQSPAANAHGWNNTDVTLSWSCTDGLSGPAASPVSQTITTEGMNQSATGTCYDLAGNSASSTDGSVDIDKTAPTLSPSISPAGAIILGGSYTANANSSDSPSGVDTSSCGPVDTSSVGSKSLSCSATDKAGNSANASLNYGVLYNAACNLGPGHQILQPINLDGSSVFKQKSTVPAKFRVCDANGNSIGTPGVVSNFYLVGVLTGTVTSTVEDAVTSTTPDTQFRWDPTEQQWIFNINTKSYQANKTYFFEIRLNDGTAIPFHFGLK